MRKLITITLLALLATACGKKKTPDPPASLTPGKTTLSAPAANATCTTGRVISNTQSAITFTWTATVNTNSYDLYIKDLILGTTTTQTATTNQLEVTLTRGNPYSWYVVSKSNQTTETATSDVFKFYNAGLATSSYAPFPADLTSPTLAQVVTATTGKVTLTWNGADVDNDIVGYDVYLGTTAATMAVVKADLVPATFDVTVTSGTTYYWKIVTKDSKANTSTSTTSQFKVN